MSSGGALDHRTATDRTGGAGVDPDRAILSADSFSLKVAGLFVDASSLEVKDVGSKSVADILGVLQGKGFGREIWKLLAIAAFVLSCWKACWRDGFPAHAAQPRMCGWSLATMPCGRHGSEVSATSARKPAEPLPIKIKSVLPPQILENPLEAGKAILQAGFANHFHVGLGIPAQQFDDVRVGLPATCIQLQGDKLWDGHDP